MVLGLGDDWGVLVFPVWEWRDEEILVRTRCLNGSIAAIILFVLRTLARNSNEMRLLYGSERLTLYGSQRGTDQSAGQGAACGTGVNACRISQLRFYVSVITRREDG